MTDDPIKERLLRDSAPGAGPYTFIANVAKEDIRAVIAALEAAEQLNERLVKRTGDCTIQIDHLLRQVAAMEPVVAAAKIVRMAYDHDGGGGMCAEFMVAVRHLNEVVDRATQSARHTEGT